MPSRVHICRPSNVRDPFAPSVVKLRLAGLMLALCLFCLLEAAGYGEYACI
jgi:hypothetical protein